MECKGGGFCKSSWQGEAASVLVKGKDICVGKTNLFTLDETVFDISTGTWGRTLFAPFSPTPSLR